MTIYKYIFTILLALPVLSARQGLKGNTITWNAQQVYDLTSNILFSQSDTFISYSLTKFEMVHHSTTVMFTVPSWEGDWKDVSQSLQIRFTVRSNGTPGLITVSRDDDDLYQVLDMTPAQPNAIKSKYLFSSFTIHE